MTTTRSVVGSLIVLLSGIFLFLSLSNMAFSVKMVTTYKYYTMIGAILLIVFKDSILDKLNIKS